MKKFILCTLLLITILCVSACGCGKYISKYDENYVYDGESLVGIWQEKEPNEQEYQTYEFFSDGTVVRSVYSFGILMQSEEATYKIEGDNTMVVKWNNGYTDKNDFSITRKNVLVICQVLDSKTLEMELIPYELDYNKANNDIVGSWRSTENKNEIFTFNKDYTGKASGSMGEDSFLYSLKEDNLFISYEIDENIKAPVEAVSYKVSGDTLTLTGKNADGGEMILTFERVK